MNPVSRIDLRGRQVRHDVDAVEKMAGEFFEIFNFADAVHLGNDTVEHAFDFFVGSFLEEGPLAFQAALMPQKLFSVEVRDEFPL